MLENFDLAIVFSFFGWLIIGLLTYRLYKKQENKPKIWKIFIVIVIGIFSFTIKLDIYFVTVSFAILPLGVWLLAFICRKNEGKWQRYRQYAWLGFFANYIFLSMTLLIIPVNYLFYPINEITTYISNVDNVAIIRTHPSAKNSSLNKEALVNQLQTAQEAQIDSAQWYSDMVLHVETNERNERFPYLLTGTLPKWGSGIHANIYIEDDGKGILIASEKGYSYYRFEESLTEGGGR
ncbi:hypothetical protein [Solibacillus sp. CAU 1738]|uniref:hypothetical protein n=1 Tax=Solibacillus sp. CAU 1738 TaxID=3140363 RepID=UPI0032615619